MEIEQLEIRDYVSKCSPFEELDEETLNLVINALEITYVRAGETVLKVGDKNESLYLIRKGAIEVFDPEGNLHNRFSAGNWTGYRSLLEGGDVTMNVTVIEDTLFYIIPGELFLDIIKNNKGIKAYFARKKTKRLRKAIESIRSDDDNSLVSSSVRDLIYSEPLLVDKNITIREAAQKMTEKAVTAMLVLDDGKLDGIVTERAYCTEVAAKGLPLDRPLSEIMTRNLITISVDTSGSDALLIMARHHVRHIPVLDHGKVAGLITATDLIRRQSHNTLYIINEIHRAKDIAELAKLSKQIPQMLVRLVSNSLTANDTARALSSVGEAITQRIIKLAIAELGEAPVPFAWIAAGSLARFEQTVHSDQDNALILSNDFDEALHDDYFKKLALFVTDGLNECGYVYCPGEVMAINKRWRQPLRVWERYFETWVNKPEPKSLMYISVFFDLRCVCGEQGLLDELHQGILKKTQGNSIFLTYMAANALQYTPPLGFFRNFVLEREGHEEPALDMKKRGVTPIVDIARVYALSAGLADLNTHDRLLAAEKNGVLSKAGMEDLRDAYEFISTVRLQHQKRQIELDAIPDNFVPPDELSALERRHLKDAFDVVRIMQSALEQRYQAGRLI